MLYLKKRTPCMYWHRSSSSPVNDGIYDNPVLPDECCTLMWCVLVFTWHHNEKGYLMLNIVLQYIPQQAFFVQYENIQNFMFDICCSAENLFTSRPHGQNVVSTTLLSIWRFFYYCSLLYSPNTCMVCVCLFHVDRVSKICKQHVFWQVCVHC